VAITSGGKLLDMAQKNHWSNIRIPQGFPPRQAFGYLFFPALLLLNKFSKKSISERIINKVYQLVKILIKRNDEALTTGKLLSKDLAIKLQHKIPIIYSTEPYFKAVATRWRTQFQENSKSMAFCNVIPEMNHNEIVGWEMDNSALKNYVVIFLENDINPTRIKTRIKLTKNIITKKGIEVVEIYSQGDSLVENVISLICIGDWVSYYLALLYEKNPASILNIDYLKSELKKMA
jgi:glucose/mannose-6-phosphate isomerase